MTGRILGVDPGTVRMGYGVIEGEPPVLVASGVLSAPPRAPLSQRLLTLYQSLEAVVHRFLPQEMAVEEPFVARNPRSGIAVGRAQAIALLVAAQHHLPVHCYPPAEVKQGVTGYGGGDKRQVQEMVRALLSLGEVVPPTDATDALAVALLHHHRRSLPEALREAPP